jgi:antitoxin component of MazEF toxin-antitoxin module
MTVAVKNKPSVVVPQAALKRAGFKRGQQLEFKASGGVITIVPKASCGEDYPLETVMRIINEEKKHPMSDRQAAALDAELMAYGAKNAKKAGIRERDIPRLVHEYRARRRTP